MNIGITLTSSMDVDQKYIDLTTLVAEHISAKGFGIVYGGTSFGMMKQLAEAYKGSGGKHLCGVLAEDLMRITKNYQKYEHLDEEFVVSNIEDRKKKIMELSNAFLILPGGYGTFEEIGSIIGGQANKLYSKPIAFLNLDHFYDELFDFMRKMFAEKFSKIAPEELFFTSNSLEDIFTFYSSYSEKILQDKFV